MHISAPVKEAQLDIFKLLQCQAANCFARMGERVPLTLCLACGNEGCPGYVSAELIVSQNDGDIREAIKMCKDLTTM
jgi:hypothetical protein